MAFPITNYHTHTSRCKHAQGTDRDYVQQAVDSGYQVLGFTDHVAWPFSDGFVSPVRMDAGQMPEYAASILKLKEEYAWGRSASIFPTIFPGCKSSGRRWGWSISSWGSTIPPTRRGGPSSPRPPRRRSWNNIPTWPWRGWRAGCSPACATRTCL